MLMIATPRSREAGPRHANRHEVTFRTDRQQTILRTAKGGNRVTPEIFHQPSLELPKVMEWEHHGKSDFRAGGHASASPNGTPSILNITSAPPHSHLG